MFPKQCCVKYIEVLQSWLETLQGPTDPPSEKPGLIEHKLTVTLDEEANRETVRGIPFENNVNIETEIFSDRLYAKVLTRFYDKMKKDTQVGHTIK